MKVLILVSKKSGANHEFCHVFHTGKSILANLRYLIFQVFWSRNYPCESSLTLFLLGISTPVVWRGGLRVPPSVSAGRTFSLGMVIDIDESLTLIQHSNRSTMGDTLRIRINGANVATFLKKIEHAL